MNRTTRIFLVALSLLAAGSASAAIFDSIDSVETLKIVAEQKSEKADRMPAGKVTDPSKDDDATTAPTTDDSKKN
jgi:hypothetical protein